MVTVGVRELKNRLSEYLRMVRHGEEVLVTDRGKVIAELRPPGQARANSPLEELARQGKVRLGLPNDPSVYRLMPPLATREEILRMLDESRGDR
jgi:antitoxin (DNA-binding transcriptional repressor) of toxin-antitoxin stability system